jgi:hypothetical protein
MPGDDGDNVYPFPPAALGGQAGAASRPPGGRGKRRHRGASRLSKTAAGLALIIGTGGSVVPLSGAEALASTRSPVPGVSAARVVDIAQSSRKTPTERKKPSSRKAPSSETGPPSPDDDGPSAA